MADYPSGTHTPKNPGRLFNCYTLEKEFDLMTRIQNTNVRL